MTCRTILWCAVAICWSSAPQTLAAETVNYAAPPGITLIDMVPKLKLGFLENNTEEHWTRLGDAHGHTLYTWDGDTAPGESACTGDCAETFSPIMALPGSQQTEHWTLVKRKEGGHQWAYRGKPLYRFARETHVHEVPDNPQA